jgi:hypothetical protein
MRRAAIVAIVLVLAGCGDARPTTQPTAAATAGGAGCTLRAMKFSELKGCQAASEQVSLVIPDSKEGKTSAKIVIASKDPLQILAAIAAYTYERRGGVHSFTVFSWVTRAGVSIDEYSGRLYWNNDGPIAVDICTAWVKIKASGGSIELCDTRTTLTLAND